MEVDMEPVDDQPTGNEQVLNDLLAILERVATEPMNLSLLKDYLRIARASGMSDQILRALEMAAESTSCTSEIWLKILASYGTEFSTVDSPERLEAMLSLVSKACQDYLSLPVLRKISELLILNSEAVPASLNGSSSAEEPQTQDGSGTLTEEQARRGLREAVKLAEFDISKSHMVWDIYRDWELSMLDRKVGDERLAAIEAMHRVYLGRLSTVHATHEETSQAYSIFNSAYSPESYEANMIKSTKASQKSNARWEIRDIWEQGYVAIEGTNPELMSQADLRNQKVAYLYAYLEMETNTDGGRKPEAKMVQGVFERMLAVLSEWPGLEGKQMEARMWEKYGAFMATTNGFARIQIVQVWQRAARCCPGSGELWARLMRIQEHDEVDPTAVGDIYMRALSLGEITAPKKQGKKGKEANGSASELVTLECAWASFLRRMQEAQAAEGAGADSEDNVSASLRSAIERCKAVDSTPDPTMRLERYLISWLDRNNKAEEAIAVWESLAKAHGKSCQFWLDYARFTLQRGQIGKTRSIYKIVASRPNIDWPDAAWEAWIMFEETHGSSSTLETAKNKVMSLQDAMAKKRAHDQEVKARHAPIEETVPQVEQSSAQPAATVFDEPATDTSRKRKADDPMDGKGGKDGGKKARTDDARPQGAVFAQFKPSENAPARDREHCTVMVTGLAKGATEQSVKQRFSDCGNIRDVVVTSLSDQDVATVEFESIESIPAALTKDKKIIDGAQINVYVAWNSTLYVTNFPEKADDAYIRSLFEEFGEIFGTRWPSKKFASKRRFVYVQYVDPACAQAALALHHRQLEPGRILNVLLSDPDHKRERTDANADARELFIASLSKFVTEQDLRKLFAPFGAIKRINVVRNEQELCKGIAFLEFETELSAKNALSLDKTEFKKRQIAVVMSSAGKAAAKDRGSSSKAPGINTVAVKANNKRAADILGRSLRFKGLPKRAQEGLLQQAVEKIAPVRTVEIFQETNEAAVELTEFGDMAKFLLRAEPFLFEGSALQIEAEKDLSQHSTVPMAVAQASTQAPETTPLALMPQPRKAAKKRLGLGARSSAPVSVGVSSASSAPSFVAAKQVGDAEPKDLKEQKGQDDFRRMLLQGKK